MLKLKLSEIEEKNIEDLIIGLKRCPKRDLLLIFNNENITEIIIKIITYHYAQNKLYDSENKKDNLNFLYCYISDLYIFKNDNNIILTPRLIINSLYYENIKEVIKTENKLFNKIKNINNTKIEKETTERKLEHIQKILALIFNVTNIDYQPLSIIRKLNQF